MRACICLLGIIFRYSRGSWWFPLSDVTGLCSAARLAAPLPSSHSRVKPLWQASFNFICPRPTAAPYQKWQLNTPLDGPRFSGRPQLKTQHEKTLQETCHTEGNFSFLFIKHSCEERNHILHWTQKSESPLHIMGLWVSSIAYSTLDLCFVFQE